MRGRLAVERMGQVPYRPMLWLQESRHGAVADGADAETLFLLEHEPVITLGKNSTQGNVVATEQALADRGVDVVPTGRGGDVTFHGPGQIVGYPILKLQEGEQDIKAYVSRLEEILIRTVADFGVQARRIEGLRGIWVGNEKIGAIGVRIARWTTLHGFALNVCPDLGYYNLIVPCGIVDKGVTSLARLLGNAAPPLLEVENRLVHHSHVVLERETYEAGASALPEEPYVASRSVSSLSLEQMGAS